MPQIVKPEMLFDASILDSSVKRLSHTSNWALGVALCREHERAFGFLMRRLSSSVTSAVMLTFRRAAFVLPKRVEDRTLNDLIINANYMLLDPFIQIDLPIPHTVAA
jgi:hypothetical protein